MYDNKLELNFKHIGLEEKVWGKFMKKLHREYRKVDSPEPGIVEFYYKNEKMDAFQIRVFVSNVLSDFLDKNKTQYFKPAAVSAEYGHKILPIDTDPESATYLFYSTKLCIIQTQGRLKEWLLGNFINILLFYNPGNSNNFFLDERMEYIFLFDRKSMEDMRAVEDIIQYTRRQLEQNLYVNIHLDEFYLCAKDNYDTRHYVHENLIYGYDDREAVFYAYGFGHQQRMETYTISYEEYVMAYEKGRLFYFCGAPYLDGDYPYPVEMRSLKPDVSREFTRELFLKRLREYTDPKEDETVEGDLHIYGMNVYRYIIRCLKEGGDHPVDFRTFQLLQEHKRCILRRVRYLADKYGLQEELQSFCKEYSGIAAAYQGFKLIYLKQLLAEGVTGQLGQRVHDRELEEKLAERMEALVEQESKLLRTLEGILCKF